MVQLLKGTDNVLFADGGDIILLKITIPFVASGGIHQRNHAGFLHQIAPDATVEIAGDHFHGGVFFLK